MVWATHEPRTNHLEHSVHIPKCGVKCQSLDRLTVNRIKSVGSVSVMRHRAPLYKLPGWDLTVQLLRLGALVLWDRHWYPAARMDVSHA
jgi:hypothetical protein